MKMQIIIKSILAMLSFICIAKVPYGYFQFVRIAACIGFLYLAYAEFEEDNMITGILSVAFAILFNPVFKIYFTRKIWNQIDVAIAILLITWIIFDLSMKNKAK